jgi:hypothetical protein
VKETRQALPELLRAAAAGLEVVQIPRILETQSDKSFSNFGCVAGVISDWALSRDWRQLESEIGFFTVQGRVTPTSKESTKY